MTAALALPRAVTTLTRPHIRTVGDTTGVEPPLLDLLQRAITPSPGGGVGSLGQSGGSPINLGATILWATIEREMCLGRWGTAVLPSYAQHTPTTTHVEEWWGETATTAEGARVISLCEGWVREIQDLLDPPRRHPLRGTACPACGHAWTNRSLDGERVRVESLVAYLDGDTPYIECWHCTQVWEGRQIHDLKTAVGICDPDQDQVNSTPRGTSVPK